MRAATYRIALCHLLAGALALTSACANNSGFSCTTADQCKLEGLNGMCICDNAVNGVCNPPGQCVLPTKQCASGFQYVAGPHDGNNCYIAPATTNDLSLDIGASADMCVGSSTDNNNCGFCGNVCKNGQFCNGVTISSTNGAPVPPTCQCPAAIPNFCTADLGSFCTNEQTDVANCGMCGHACVSGQLCQSGNCVETCAMSPLVYANCTTYCADTQNDLNNCGSCGTACTLDPNATSVECVQGSCHQACNVDYVNCGTGCCGLALVAGQLGGAGNIDGTGSAARFGLPIGVAVDGNGNVYVADSSNFTVRKITPSGVVSTFAGSAGQIGSADGTGTAAQFSNPTAIAADASGNVYVADEYAIRKITASAVVSTFYRSVLGIINGVAVDRNGNVYVAISSTILEISSEGVLIPSFAVTGVTPTGIAVDASGNVYITNFDSSIAKITTGGVSIFAGSAGGTGSADGTGSAALFYHPTGLAIDASGNIYVADTGNSTVRKITPSGVVSTLAGSAGENGSADGTGSAARFQFASAVAVDGSGNVYVADGNNSAIRTITPSGVVSTFAGSAAHPGTANGNGSVAHFASPSGVAVDTVGTMYVADAINNTIRKITAGGGVSTFAGAAGMVNAGTADGTGTAAQFLGPQGVAIDGSGNLYVAEMQHGAVRMITPNGVVRTLSVNVANAFGIAVDGSGNIYVTEERGVLAKISADSGTLSPFAGNNMGPGTMDGTGTAAQFSSNPSGVTIDGSGNLYVADAGNQTIRKITPNASVTTLAGTAGSAGTTDGTGSAARFSNPMGVAVDASGNVYVADSGNDTIRKVTPSGVVSTVVGAPQKAGVGLGPLPATLNYPISVAVFGDTLIIVNRTENAILRATKVGGF